MIFIFIRVFCVIYCIKCYILPLIPHFEVIFCSRALAKLMIWHKDHKSAHGFLNGPQDGEAWK